MRAAPRTVPVGESLEVDLVYLVEDRHHSLLDKFVLHCRHGQCELHLITMSIWDGRRFVIRFIRFEANASRYSRSAGSPASIR